MKVSQVGDMPDPKPPVPGGRTPIDWTGLAAGLRANPGEPVLMDGFTQTDQVETILTSIKRTPRPKALRSLEGDLSVNIRNSATDVKTGRLVGDVWVTYKPKED